MNKISLKGFVLILSFVLCIMFTSCNFEKSVLRTSSEVDFSVPINVQISFNGHIYDTVVVFNNSKLEVNFSNEKDLMGGAYVSIDAEKYKISYNDMVFDGETTSLSDDFLPNIIYLFLSEFDSNITLELYDDDRDCYYLKQNLNNYFVILEAYEKEKNISYSIEIK